MYADDLRAGTQYGDLVGTSSIDGHAMVDLTELAQKHDVDLHGCIPVGVNLYSSGKYDSVSIYAAPGFSDYDELRWSLRTNPEPLKVVSFTIPNMTIAEFIQEMKRFSVVAKSQIVRNHHSFEIIESDELDES